MAARAWIERVRRTGQLSYFVDSSVAGAWATVITETLTEFDRISQRESLGVRFVAADQAPTDTAGADVQFATGSGEVTINWNGEHRRIVDGVRLHGNTFAMAFEGEGTSKAFIYLPAQPQVNTPSGQRAVGTGVMKVIVFHEMLHACGLSNDEHSTDDVFNGYPSVTPDRSPARDRVTIMVNGRYVHMPPIVMATGTINLIRGLWRA